MNSQSDIAVYYAMINEAYEKKDVKRLEKLRAKFSEQIMDIHDKRIKNGGNFQNNNDAVRVDSLSNLAHYTKEKIYELLKVKSN